MVKGKSKGHDTKGNDGSRYYLLVDPRPGEAPDYDNSTLVQNTGTGRSLVHNRDVMDNTRHSQHLKDEGAGRGAGTYEGGGVGRSAKKNKEDARRGGDMYKVRGAGLDGTVKDGTAGGATWSNIEDRGAGLDGTKKGGTAGGATRSHTEDRGAGLDGTVKDGTAGGAKRSDTGKVVRSIRGGGRRATRWVRMNLGGEQMNLYCDTGSNITIITPEMYKNSMGKLVAARSYLRAWGSTDYLDTKGMFKTTLTTASGATKRTWVYVVAGARP